MVGLQWSFLAIGPLGVTSHSHPRALSPTNYFHILYLTFSSGENARRSSAVSRDSYTKNARISAMEDKNVSLVKKIVSDIIYLNLATCDGDGNPWNSPLFYAFDKKLNFYWSSHPTSQHSKNIEASGKAFIVIYNSKADEGEGDGVYIKAKAQVLNEKDEVKSGLDLLGERRGKPFTTIDKFIEGGPQRIYKAVPLQVWVNDSDQDKEGDFIRDFRINVPIAKITESLKT